MTDPDADRSSDRRPRPVLMPDTDRGGDAEAAKFAELRSVLVGPERRFDVKMQSADRQARTLEVGEVLPEAIAQSAGDPHLARALIPAIEQALTQSARKDPRVLAGALVPVIGRALRKSIAQTLTPLITLGCAALLVAGVWTFQGFRERQRWNDYVQRLGAEPGIVVIRSGRQDGKYFVSGLRDELAVDPAALLASSGLSPGSVEGRWEPYQALHPRFVSERARSVLRPPLNVTLSYRDGVLTATGTAPAEWVKESRLVAPALAGVRRFEFSGDSFEGEEALVHAELGEALISDVPLGPEPPAPRPLGPSEPSPLPIQQSADTALSTLPPVAASASELRLMEQIEVSTLEFSPIHADLIPGQDATVRRLTSLFRELNEIVHARGARASIDFIGHAGDIAAVASRDLARARANAALALFRASEFDSLVLTETTAPGTLAPDDVLNHANTDRARRVSFRVRLMAPREQ